MAIKKFKRRLLRYNKRYYEQSEKFQHSLLANAKPNRGNVRTRRALKSTSVSRTFGLSNTHKSTSSSSSSSSSTLNSSRRNNNNKKIDNDIAFEKKKKSKTRGSCSPLPNDTYIKVEIVKVGRDKNNTYSSGTVVKITCSEGYGSNVQENETAKCVRGKWKPVMPECLSRKFIIHLTL